MKKSIAIQDLFHTSWDSLRSEKGGNQVIMTMRYLQIVRATLEKQSYTQFGYYLRILLRTLTRKKSPLNLRSLGEGGPEQLVDIYHDLKFLHEPWYFFPTPVINLESSPLLRPPKPLAKVGRGVAEGRGVYAPDERLSNITYANWKFADAKFTKYLCHQEAGEDKEAQLELDKLMACLYIPAQKEIPPERGVPAGRGVFQESHIELHTAPLSKKLKPWEKLLAAETYGYIRTYIVQREEFLFPQDNSSKKEFPPHEGGARRAGGSPVYTGQLWQDLHYDLADTEAFRGYEAAGNANIYHALDYLNKKAREQKERTK